MYGDGPAQKTAPRWFLRGRHNCSRGGRTDTDPSSCVLGDELRQPTMRPVGERREHQE